MSPEPLSLFTAAPCALTAGVDEAGRGPLAGSVVAAAVMFAPGQLPEGVADSKTLSAAARERLAALIRQRAQSWCVASATVEEIDQMNILQATMLAMQRAVQGLATQPQYVLVDGNRLPRWSYPAEAVVKGDHRVPLIAAASILAKVHRDAELRVLDGLYPQYGFAAHKGYPTAAHLAALRRFGPCPAHRRSFAPVRAVLERVD